MMKHTVNINHRHNRNYCPSQRAPWTQHSFLPSIADSLWFAIMVPVHWSNRGRAATIEPLNQASHRSHLSLLWFWPAMETLACEATEARLIYWTWAFTWREKRNSRSWIWQSASVLLFYSVNKRQTEGRVQIAEQYVNILWLYWDQSTKLHWFSF